MDKIKRKTTLAGLYIITGMTAGIFSVAPAVDSADFLLEAAANPLQVILASLSQFIMSLTYLGFAIVLYPILKRFSSSLSIGFLSFRIITSALVIVGTLLLLAILSLSQGFVDLSQDSSYLVAIGNALKITRDYINHVFMILVLCMGNLLFYFLLFQTKLIPKWISEWGIAGTFLSAIASILILFQVFEVITTEYILLNVPVAILDLILAVWLITKGFNKTVLATEYRRISKLNVKEEKDILVESSEVRL